MDSERSRPDRRRPPSPRAWRIEFKPSAAKALRRLDREWQRRIATKIDALASDPYPAGSEKLIGADDLYRIRVGDYRVIYTVQESRLIILVVRIGHRREVYRKL